MRDGDGMVERCRRKGCGVAEAMDGGCCVVAVRSSSRRITDTGAKHARRRMSSRFEKHPQ